MRFKHAVTVCILFFVLFPLQLFSEEPLTEETSEETRTYTLAVTDIVGLEELQREFLAFQNKLTEYTGFRFKLFPVTGRTVVVESLRRQKLDFALTGPAEYVAITSRAKVKPLVGLARKNYRSAIITKSDSEITQLHQLKGKKIGFGDFGSTSYHLAPLQILADSGIDVTKEIRGVNLNKHIVWKALLRGQVQAIGFNHSRFEQFLAEDKKLSESDFRVLETGPQLPSDLFLSGAHVPESVSSALKKAFSEHGEALLESMLVGKRNKKYAEMSFVTDVSDRNYGYIRKMYITAGLENLAKHS